MYTHVHIHGRAWDWPDTTSNAYLQVSVDDGHSEVECFLQQCELEVHQDEPVNQDGSHLRVHMRLLGHVFWVDLVLSL